jgi:outer membrane scaffolding protein for murein synthesis (MipA/OmpV family)
MRACHVLACIAAVVSGAHAQTVAVAPEPALVGPGAARWEAGLAAGGGRVPDYPGSDQSHARAIALPVLIYRGPILRVDESGVRSRLLDTPRWEASLSATGAFDARDNDARRGMPGLDYLVGVGPQLIVKGEPTRAWTPSLHLKLRALLSTDFRRVAARGYDLMPELRWRAPFARAASLTLSVQPTWASRALQRYFYEVEPSQALPERPVYAARAGYLGTQLAATWSRRERRSLSWFVTARAMSLHGAANEASPLLKQRANFALGAGLVWTPWQSAARAAD